MSACLSAITNMKQNNLIEKIIAFFRQIIYLLICIKVDTYQYCTPLIFSKMTKSSIISRVYLTQFTKGKYRATKLNLPVSYLAPDPALCSDCPLSVCSPRHYPNACALS